MKLFSRTAIAAIAISILATPLAAQAQPGYQPHSPGYSKSQHYKPYKPAPAPWTKKAHRDWHKGERYSDWKKRPQVRDYQRYGLKRPGTGQQWVQVDNDYLLIGLATGVILSVMSGR